MQSDDSIVIAIATSIGLATVIVLLYAMYVMSSVM